MFKLRDWPFGPGELSTLRWIKSPYANEKNEWILPVVFEGEENDMAQVDTLWGSVLLLRYGQIYQDGKPFEICKEGTIMTLEIEDASQGDFCKASELSDFLPEGIFNIGSENCWVFKNKGYKVFIPCIEIVRSFLTPNITMANALITPYGLDDIATFEIHGKQISIDLKNSVPKQIIKYSFVNYLAWLKGNELANEAWDSVYRELIPNGAINEMLTIPLFDDSGEPLREDKRIKVKFPVAGSCKLQVRAIFSAYKVFVLEIQRVDELSLPFSNVFYTHSSFKAKRNITDNFATHPKRTVKRRKKVRDEKKLISVSPTALSKTVILNTDPTLFVFNQRITMTKVSDYVPRYRRRPTDEYFPVTEKELMEAGISIHKEKYREQYISGREGGEETPEALFSTGDIFFDGDSKVFPVEVQGVKVVHAAFSNSFEKFFNMLNLLERMESHMEVGVPKVMNLPGLKGFAKKREDGTPRQFVLVPVNYTFSENKQVYILEIERSPKMRLSTLLIWPREGKVFTKITLDNLIEKLLINLLRNNGHWERADITKSKIARIISVKHLDMWEPIDWAEIILSHIA